jgi:DNA-directed RNA polymerase beta subunit
MEKDCLIAHGAALLLKERFSSDLSKIPICADCGLVAVEDKVKKRAKLDINGHVETIETDKALFTKNIDNKISEGNNFVRLEPLEDVEVVELKIELK